MGWKLALIVVKDRDATALSGVATGDEVGAARVLRRLGYCKTVHMGSGHLIDDCHPADDEVLVGVYEGGSIVADTTLVSGILRNPAKDMERRPLLDAFPRHRILVASLFSVTNSYGHATFLDGEFVRAKSGDSARPVRIDAGTPHPIEEAYLARSILKRRRRYYRLEGEIDYDVDDSQIGEDVVLALLHDHIGTDWLAAGTFRLERYRKSARFLIWRRADAAKTARVLEVERAVARGDTDPAMGPFDLTRVAEAARVQLRVHGGGVPVSLEANQGEHGPWIAVECGFGNRRVVDEALRCIAVAHDLLLYVAHEGSVYNNKRVY